MVVVTRLLFVCMEGVSGDSTGDSGMRRQVEMGRGRKGRNSRTRQRERHGVLILHLLCLRLLLLGRR